LRLGPLASVLLAAAAARASGVSDEISIAGTEGTAQNQGAYNVSNLLSGFVEIGEAWTASLSARVTVFVPTPPRTGAALDRGGTVTDFSAGVDWDAMDNWTFGVTLDVSPESTVVRDARVIVQGRPTNVLVETTTSIASLEMLAGYNTDGGSDLEWSFTAAVSLSRLDTREQLVPAIGGASGVLRYGRISGSALATVDRDTDVGLDFDYYGYADNPASFGSFSTVAASRTETSAPLAPLRYLVRLGATQRFGDFSLRAWLQGGSYVPEAGGGTASLGAKAQYKLSRSFRMWLSATGQRDEDSTGAVSRTGILALGVGYRF
jgi:hypothetical protein